jgi:starch-binding outer membrane protein, SusD/RagB family
MIAAGKKDFAKDKHELLPIPQTEIDLSNGLLTQNKGY